MSNEVSPKRRGFLCRTQACGSGGQWFDGNGALLDPDHANECGAPASCAGNGALLSGRSSVRQRVGPLSSCVEGVQGTGCAVECSSPLYTCTELVASGPNFRSDRLGADCWKVCGKKGGPCGWCGGGGGSCLHHSVQAHSVQAGSAPRGHSCAWDNSVCDGATNECTADGWDVGKSLECVARPRCPDLEAWSAGHATNATVKSGACHLVRAVCAGCTEAAAVRTKRACKPGATRVSLGWHPDLAACAQACHASVFGKRQNYGQSSIRHCKLQVTFQ